MIVAFYNPYHSTLGGGEYYLFLMMQEFLSNENTVIYYSDNTDIIVKAEKQFGISLSGVIVRKPIFNNHNTFTSVFETANIDVLFWYSDGSIPFSFAKKTYLIFQFPVPWVKGTSLMQKIKLSRVSGVISNSHFTKRFIDSTFHVNSTVFYPAVNTALFQSNKKENIILSVGRFTSGMNTKKHDILISAFKSLVDTGIKEYTLVLAGGVMLQDKHLVEELKKSIQSYPIIIKENCKRDELVSLYSRASFYWHAAGYNIDEIHNPELVEHFGISIVEAMASGCIPFVFSAGGPKEIVTKQSGIIWDNKKILVDETINLLHNKKQADILRLHARDRAKDFDISHFKSAFKDYIGSST